MIASRHWRDLKTTDFSDPGRHEWIVVLPLAAIEQHGPHLPLSTDTVIAEGMIARTIDLLPAELPVLFLPVQAIGKSNEHLTAPGTLTLSWEAAIRSWIEIAESVHRAGIRKLVMVTSHGGNIAPMEIVARELRVRHDMLAVTTSWSRMGHPDGLYGDFEQAYGIHAGDEETSIMLALRPDLVDMDRAKRSQSVQQEMERNHKRLRAHGPVSFAWMSQDLNPSGAVGDPVLATPAKGQATIDHQAKGFVEVLADVAAFDMTLFKPRSS